MAAKTLTVDYPEFLLQEDSFPDKQVFHALNPLTRQLEQFRNDVVEVIDNITIAGSETFATSGTKAVTLINAENDANYLITFGGNVNETFWVTSKTTTGFTLNSSNASSTATVDWALSR